MLGKQLRNTTGLPDTVELSAVEAWEARLEAKSILNFEDLVSMLEEAPKDAPSLEILSDMVLAMSINKKDR